MIVAISAVIVVMIGAGLTHLVTEEWVVPGPRHLLLLAGAGLFLIFGHFFIFMAYRIGPTGVVAPVLLQLHGLGGDLGPGGVRTNCRTCWRLRHRAGGRERPRHRDARRAPQATR